MASTFWFVLGEPFRHFGLQLNNELDKRSGCAAIGTRLIARRCRRKTFLA